MSTPPTPTSTSGSGPNTVQWPSVSTDRSVYTYSFLGAIGFLTAVVLFFMGRSYIRRQRFAARVQQALDSGRLDPAIVNDIMNLPSGALYFASSKKARKNKVKPSMYEVRLEESGRKPIGRDVGNDQTWKWLVDWKDVLPIAVSKLGSSSSQRELTESLLQPSSSLSPPLVPMTSDYSEGSNSDTTPSASSTSHSAGKSDATGLTHAVSPNDHVMLSVFIAMPSPSSLVKNNEDDDIEDVLPDICFGVTRVNVVE